MVEKDVVHSRSICGKSDFLFAFLKSSIANQYGTELRPAAGFWKTGSQSTFAIFSHKLIDGPRIISLFLSSYRYR